MTDRIRPFYGPLPAAFAQVFDAPGFDWPFDAEWTRGRLFYPLDDFHLTEKQYGWLRTAAGAGEGFAFWVAMIEGERTAANQEPTYFDCRDPGYDEYHALSLYVGTGLVAHDGSWLVNTSEAGMALVTGSQAFLDRLGATRSDWAQDTRGLRDFLTELRADTTRLDRLEERLLFD